MRGEEMREEKKRRKEEGIGEEISEERREEKRRYYGDISRRPRTFSFTKAIQYSLDFDHGNKLLIQGRY
jgi:hypothetical protein